MLFATTPYIVRGLGPDVYGVWATTVAAVAFLGLFDLGGAAASLKYGAESIATGDYSSIKRIVGTTLILQTAIGVFLGAALFMAAPGLPERLFKIPAGCVADAEFVLRVTAFVLAAQFMRASLASIPRAAQRYGLVAAVDVIVSTGTTLAAVAVVRLGAGVRALAVAHAVMAWLAVLLHATVVLRLVPEPLVGWRFDRRLFRVLLRFGIFSALSALGSTALVQLNRLYISSLLGATALTYYVVTHAVALKIHQVVAQAAHIVFPLSSSLLARAEYQRIRRLYETGAKVTVACAAGVAVPLIPLAAPILRLWLGPEFAERSAVIFKLQICASLLLACTVVPHNLLNGIGRPHINTAFIAFETLVITVLGYLFTKSYGLIGAAVATLVAYLDVVAAIWYVEAKVLRCPVWSTSLRVYGVPILAACIGTALGNLAAGAEGPLVASIALRYLASAAAGFLLSWHMALSKQEREILIAAARTLRHWRQKTVATSFESHESRAIGS